MSFCLPVSMSSVPPLFHLCFFVHFRLPLKKKNREMKRNFFAFSIFFISFFIFFLASLFICLLLLLSIACLFSLYLIKKLLQ